MRVLVGTLRVSSHKRLQGHLRIRNFVHFIKRIDVKRLYVGINFHKNWFYSVGNGVTGVVDIVEELNEVAGEYVVMIISIGRIPPAQTQKNRQRRAEAEEVLDSEYQAGLRCTRLGWLVPRMPVSPRSWGLGVLLPLVRRARHLH